MQPHASQSKSIRGSNCWRIRAPTAQVVLHTTRAHSPRKLSSLRGRVPLGTPSGPPLRQILCTRQPSVELRVARQTTAPKNRRRVGRLAPRGKHVRAHTWGRQPALIALDCEWCAPPDYLDSVRSRPPQRWQTRLPQSSGPPTKVSPPRSLRTPQRLPPRPACGKSVPICADGKATR